MQNSYLEKLLEILFCILIPVLDVTIGSECLSLNEQLNKLTVVHLRKAMRYALVQTTDTFVQNISHIHKA
jgi:hypothetical protein